MKMATSVLAYALLVLGLSAAEMAMGRTTPYDFHLTQKMSQCDGAGTYAIDVTWTPGPTPPAYYFASGNQCRINGAVCGTSGHCGSVSCAGPGPCQAHFVGCQQGRGAPWLRVVDAGGHIQQIATSGPRPCR
jgi:hypothetical protein